MVLKVQAKKAEYDRIRAKPFVHIHGRPIHQNLDRVAREATDTGVGTRIPGYAWAGEYGILAKVIGTALFQTKTAKVYVVPVKPAAFDARINSNTGKFNQNKWTAENDQKIKSWAVLLGARERIKDNTRDAVNLQYYDQLKDKVLGFTQVSILDFLNHLKMWYRMNATLRKQMKDEFLWG